MHFSNKFKLVWWIFLLSMISAFLCLRSHALLKGQLTYVDMFAVLVWTALCLLPLYQELNFFGFSLKSRLESFERDVKTRLSEFQNEIRSVVKQNTQVHQSVNNFYTPPDESTMQSLANEAAHYFGEDTGKKPARTRDDAFHTKALPEHGDATALFLMRYTLEVELRRIWDQRHPQDKTNRQLPISKIALQLQDEEIISPEVYKLIRAVYAAASPAIHGKDVSEKERDFVMSVGPILTKGLKMIQ